MKGAGRYTETKVTIFVWKKTYHYSKSAKFLFLILHKESCQELCTWILHLGWPPKIYHIISGGFSMGLRGLSGGIVIQK